ncbi:MAG: FAD-binding protein [Pedobacter sp.]|nr:MAG: FAD-binding protein [Pedobacter sp.]
MLAEIENAIGASNVFIDDESLANYAHDETEDLKYYPEVVVKPTNTEGVSALLKICNGYKIPVTPRGGGTGLSGAALPIFGGVLLSMEKFKSIIDIDTENLQATVEPGVITEEFMNAVAEKGLLYPVDPSSKGSCFIGGNVAHGSGGPRVVKYGTIREYILNLEVVLANGDVIWTGANTLKYAVSAIFRAGVTPSALEFMERKGVEWVIKFDDIKFDLKDDVNAFLMIEFDGDDLDVIFKDCEKVNMVLEEFGCTEVLFADTAQQKEELWRMRRTMAESVKSNSVYKEEDTVVPRAALPKLVNGIKEIGARYGFESVCYGHAGDGNLHINIIKAGMSDDDWKDKLKHGIVEIFELTTALGGTISGEHGIGLVQKDYMPIKYSEIHLNLMRSIKGVFDPNGILNPGKIMP